MSENKEEFRSNALKSFRKILDEMTEEEKERMRNHFRDDTPKGWLSIDEHLPMMLIDDLVQGYSVFKVRDKDGNEFETHVTDHHIWYHHAKDAGVTHWLND